MPTPVSTARQCLTDEAARALNDAVSVARKRTHAQTTSRHVVSALLSLPSSTLRDACARARSSAYSPCLQFRALEFSVGVSLDRLPSGKAQEEPPVSNSLMAAIKRSQANQRRHPESFHLHQIHSQTASKVELKHFILSILDDPIVSRVFGEAGFRSSDIKLAVVHTPPPPTTNRNNNRFPRTTLCPPIFLCNLTDSDPTRRKFPFPFPGFEDDNNRDDNLKRIGDVLKSGKNPLLIGVSATEALKNFIISLPKSKALSSLPPNITSCTVISIETEISESAEEKIGMKLKAASRLAEQCSRDGVGVVVNLGEVKGLVDKDDSSVRFVVEELKSLVESYSGKLWLICAAGSNEYKKLSDRFPEIEKDWELHLLPISSSKASLDVYSKSSLMGSFVPFGGFFSGPSELTKPLSISKQSFIRCHMCTEKYEQEVASFGKNGLGITVGVQCSKSSPPWLQMSELDASKGVDLTKTKADYTTLSDTVSGLQKKWNDICRKFHHAEPKLDIQQAGSPDSSHVAGDRRESSDEDSSLHESQSAKYQCLPVDMQKSFRSKQNEVMQVASDAENAFIQSKLLGNDSKGQQLESGSPCSLGLSLPTDHSSPTSVPSVTTDLGLGTFYASTNERLQCLSSSVSAQSSCSGSFGGQIDPRDFKSLGRGLVEKVGWQDEAVSSISQAISRCMSGCGRSRGSKVRADIWLHLTGPDRVGKKKIALALAEIMLGTRESLISVDMAERGDQPDSVFQWESQDDYVKFRGKMAIDYVAGQLSRRPQSVVFLENVDKADFMAQSNLSRAIRTGKFPDFHGREFSMNNMIFVTTSSTMKGSRNIENGSLNFSEEIILGAKRCQIQILNAGDASKVEGTNVKIAPREGTCNPSLNKRKLIDCSASANHTVELPKRAYKASRSFLDLNLPLEEIEGMNCGDYDSDSISENTEAWMEDFLDLVDEAVVLKPFNFDGLAEKIVKVINREFKEVFRSEDQLEIDFEVMVQLLAACWLSGKNKSVEEWIEQVLSRSFTEAHQRYCLSPHSVMKLVACGALSVQEQTPGVCLPAKISFN